jgi:arabinofuranosyltransferase
MAKPKKKQEKQQKDAAKQIDLSFALNISPAAKKIILAVLLILSVVLPYYYISNSYSVNKYYSFPLDDPWIHLQFAKNLAEYGSFSYYKNEIVTAGSTSPIYTVILAAGFLVTKNEMWLSYILGILFFSLAVFYFYRLSEDTFPKENWLAIGAALIFVLDKWLNLISVTGMETTMYIFMLVACLYYYRKRRAVPFAIMLGLTFWARPDAVAFIGALAVDYMLLLYMKQKSPKNNDDTPVFTRQGLIKIGAISGGIFALYFLMNLMISGSLLPNTYGAKISYYSAEFRSRTDFLKVEVWEYFTESAYLLLIIPFFAAVIKIFSDLFKFRYNKNTIAVVFIFALIFIYWYQLPYAHRFGRYLMPVFPFYILLFVYGSRQLFTWFSGFTSDKKLINGLNITLIAATVIYFASVYYKHKDVYQDQSRHIYIRQVEAAKWLKNNTPEGSVIATHDVGAVAFYSDRKIVDVVGLINPEFIPKLNSKEFVGFVQQQMKKQNVSYVAFLKEWFQVVNQPQLFSAGENNFEIMEIYKYSPDSTHILSSEVNSGIRYAGEILAAKQYKQAATVLNQVLTMDPNSSLTYYMLAYTYSALGDAKASEKYLEKAVELYPGYKEAVYGLGNVYRSQNKITEAKNVYSAYLKTNPSDTAVARILGTLKDTIKTDTTKLNK